MIKIIAFDPGITTGYAQGTIFDDGPMLVTTGEDKLDHLQFSQFISIFEPNFLVCENFLARHSRYRQGVELAPREYLGIAKMYCLAYDCELVLQNPMKGGKSRTQPGSPSSFFSDERLKKDAIFKSGKGHANDAARHLLYWYWFGSGGQFNSRTRGYKTGVI